jgi:hypothetical protein
MRTRFEQTADHEASHVAMARTLDLRIDVATVIPDAGPHGPTLGHVIITPPDGITPHDFNLKSALVLLAGMLENDDPGVEPRPTTATAVTGDEADPAVILDHLNVDDEQYRGLVNVAERLMLTRDFQRIKVTVGHLLEQRHYLDDVDLLLALAVAERTDRP